MSAPLVYPASGAEYKQYCTETLGVDSGALQVETLPYPYCRGIILGGNKPARKGQVLLTVPVTAFLSVLATSEGPARKFFDVMTNEMAALQPKNPDPKQTTPSQKWAEDDQLALLILFEKNLKSKSKYQRHIEALPSDYDLPFSWTEEELEASQGAGIYEIAVAMRKQLLSDYQKLAKLVDKHGGDWGFSSRTTFTLAAYTWAIMSVWSRAVSLKINGMMVKVIAPFFDMFNHDASARTRHFYDATRRALTVVTDEAIEPGTHVCLNYGVHTSADSVRLRGFVTPGNAFEYYVVQIAMSRGPTFAKRLELVKISPPVGKSDPSKPLGGIDREEAGQLAIVPDGIIGEFQLFENCYNNALHRVAAIQYCPPEKLDDLAAALTRDKGENVGIEEELDTLNFLGDSLVKLRERLVASPDEKEHLLAITADSELGAKALTAYTTSIQAAMGYVPVPPPQAASSVAAVAAAAAGTGNGDANDDGDDDDDWGTGLSNMQKQQKGKNNKGKKGKNGNKDKSSSSGKNNNNTNTNTSSEETGNNAVGAGAGAAPVAATSETTTTTTTNDVASTTTSSSSTTTTTTTLTYSKAGEDTHLRRLQMISYIRNMERRILDSTLSKIAISVDSLRSIVEQYQGSGSSLGAGGGGSGEA